MLPIFQSKSRELNQMQTAWASQIDPVISSPLSGSILIKNISLVSGSNTINHKLSRKLQGWVVTGMHNSFVQLYDLQSTNQMSDKTLILNSSGTGLIDLLVF